MIISVSQGTNIISEVDFARMFYDEYSNYGKIERETFVNAYGLQCLFAVDVDLIMEY